MSGGYLSVVEDVTGLLGRDLIDGPFRCRTPFPRRRKIGRRVSRKGVRRQIEIVFGCPERLGDRTTH
jgi:hypothetical protein